MPTHTTVEVMARDLLDRHARQFMADQAADDVDAVGLDLQPALWVLSELLCQAAEQAPPDIKASVRRRLVELIFMDQGGDAVIDPHHQPRLDAQVELVVHVIEQLEIWPDPPEMEERRSQVIASAPSVGFTDP
jgi:hypothetical protein